MTNLCFRTPQEQRGVQALWKGPWNPSQPHQVSIVFKIFPTYQLIYTVFLLLQLPQFRSYPGVLSIL